METIKVLPKFKRGGDSNMTCLQGYINNVTYDELKKVFGKHNSKGDEYKIDAEWELTFISATGEETVVTIYNWKNGVSYLGRKEGTKIKDITNWHIGGHNKKSVHHLQQIFGIKVVPA